MRHVYQVLFCTELGIPELEVWHGFLKSEVLRLPFRYQSLFGWTASFSSHYRPEV